MPAHALSADPARNSDALSRRDFARVSQFIFDTAGIKMPESKRSMLEGRLRRRVRATDTNTLADYCTHVFDAGHLAEESLHLINAVTTNKTDFFREPRHFDYLRATALPALAAAGTRMIRAWSAACSTGAEPYTIAMMLDDFAQGADGPSFGILATDIDTEVLETARQGIYPADVSGADPGRAGPALRHGIARWAIGRAHRACVARHDRLRTAEPDGRALPGRRADATSSFAATC